MISNLQESRNEWCSRLIGILSPLLNEGINSIFNEAWKICVNNDETAKYLMTFQNLLCSVPKWNSIIVENERKRIIERSGCNYLEDLITCVHIIQLKVLTCIKVGNKQKKIDISIPKLDNFLHKTYVHIARKVYTNVYLFDRSVNPLEKQKNNRELEKIIQECIMVTVRESIPTEAIIRAYMDESVEQEEEIIIENVDEAAAATEETKTADATDAAATATATTEETPATVPSIKNIDEEKVVTQLKFNDIDSVLTNDNKVKEELAPKTIERLEEISTERALQRKMEEEEEDEKQDRLKINFDENVDLSGLDIFDMELSEKPKDDLALDIEEIV